MDPQAAGELVQAWLQAHDDPAAVSSQRGPVSRAVRALLPDAKHMGVAHTSTGPAMAVLIEGALLLVQAQVADAGDPTPPPVRARLVRLDAAATDIEVLERFEGHAGRMLRMRRWRLRSAGIELQFEGGEVVQGGTLDEQGRPDANETLSRVIAARLGWQLP
jgi:hypothetical protein